jgi:hypothetical protein
MWLFWRRRSCDPALLAMLVVFSRDTDSGANESNKAADGPFTRFRHDDVVIVVATVASSSLLSATTNLRLSTL